MATMNEKRIAWGITGAGHALKECLETLLQCECVDVVLSRAAEEVLRMYALDTHLNAAGLRLYRETDASSSLVARLYSGIYRLLVIAPATSNSVAKFVHGISDTLVTNLFAQAGKARIPVVVYPTDLAPEVDSMEPGGRSVKIYPRAIDLENASALTTFAGVTVVRSRKDLQQHLV